MDSADLAQAFGLSDLTEEHGYKMVPAFKSFWISFCLMFPGQLYKFVTIEKRYQLTEQACMSSAENSNIQFNTLFKFRFQKIKMRNVKVHNMVSFITGPAKFLLSTARSKERPFC